MIVCTRNILSVCGATLALTVVGLSGHAQGLIDRYSFTNGASDSVGGANGVLVNGATVSGGAVHLDGIDQYVSLPIGNTIAGLTNATFETWVTWDTFQSPWSRIFDFGQNTTDNMFLTPRNGRFDYGPAIDTPRFSITTGGGGLPEQQTTSANQLPVGVETFLAVTIDSADHTGTLYVNGIPVATNPDMTLTPSSLGNTPNNWLGRSQYNDPYFAGSIDEFRIYNVALSDNQVLASFLAGPNVVTPEPDGLPLLTALACSSAAFIAGRRRKESRRKKPATQHDL